MSNPRAEGRPGRHVDARPPESKRQRRRRRPVHLDDAELGNHHASGCDATATAGGSKIHEVMRALVPTLLLLIRQGWDLWRRKDEAGGLRVWKSSTGERVRRKTVGEG
ncbi:hypothetical protein MTO96_009375 [Rhipicephalus appendiculatus]